LGVSKPAEGLKVDFVDGEQAFKDIREIATYSGADVVSVWLEFPSTESVILQSLIMCN